MKCIIIGLGNFGASLGEKLTQLGHEVIGVDRNIERVEEYKERLTHAIRLNCTDQQAVGNLPLRDTDVVIVCIGEHEGDNIMTTALMKQMGVKRLISRAVGPLHKTVLEAMGVKEIVHPEEETAERWAQKLNVKGVLDSYELTEDYNIVEAEVPEAFTGKTLMDLGITGKYDLLVLSTLKIREKKNVLGATKEVKEVQGVATSKTVLEKGDTMVLFGNMRDIRRMLKEEYGE